MHPTGLFGELMTIAAVFSNYFQAIGRTVIVNIMSVLEGIGAMVPLGLLLIPRYGVDGNLLTFLIGYVAVPPEKYEGLKQDCDEQINAYLKKHRAGRCIIYSIRCCVHPEGLPAPMYLDFQAMPQRCREGNQRVRPAYTNYADRRLRAGRLS